MHVLNLEVLKGKVLPLFVLAIGIVVVLIISLDTLEDTLIDGGSFGGTPLALLLRIIVAFTQNVTLTVSSWGYAGIFSLMALESSSLPIPSEIILPFAGYLISQGQLNFWMTLSIATLAGITGSLVDYYIGLKGTDLIAHRRILGKLILNESRLETAERWFKKYGVVTVFLSRLVPAIRTLISFPAGATKMSLIKFIACTTAGCLAWNATLIYVGMYLGANWRQATGISGDLIIGSAIAVLTLLVFFLIVRKKKA